MSRRLAWLGCAIVAVLAVVVPTSVGATAKGYIQENLVSDQPGDDIVRRRRRELLRPARRAALAESIELCVRRALAPPRGADARLTVPVNRRAVVANVEPLRELEARLGDTDRPLRATAPAIAMFLTTCADSPVYDPRATPAELRQLLRRALLSSGAR